MSYHNFMHNNGNGSSAMYIDYILWCRVGKHAIILYFCCNMHLNVHTVGRYMGS